MNFEKGNFNVCLACRTVIAELIKVWCEYLDVKLVAPSLLIKQTSRLQSFHAVSWAVNFATTICVFLHTAVKTKDKSQPVSNLTFSYCRLKFDIQSQIDADRQSLNFFF